MATTRVEGCRSNVVMAEEWHDGHKRQIEIYQWLRQNGFTVSDTGYWVCLDSDALPDAAGDCDYCRYRERSARNCVPYKRKEHS